MFLTNLNGLTPRKSRRYNNIFESFLTGFEPWNLIAEERGVDFAPQIDVSETESNIVVKADLPGMKLEDINLDLDEDTLTLSGKKEEEVKKCSDNGHCCYSERKSGSFRRVITLNREIDREKVDVLYKDGVLSITLPKLLKAENSAKKLKIRTE